MVDLYIYYQVRNEHAARLEPLVRSMQAGFALSHGVQAQLKRRPETTNGLQTWMEVYPATDEAFVTLLEAAGSGAAIAALIEGRRHTEIFTDLPPCA
jgi:hypothetical protein